MKFLKALGTIIATVVLNYVTYRLAVFLDIPLFLDTWATGLATLIGGLAVGVFGGALYNVLLAILSGEWTAATWGLSSAFVALAIWFFDKKGWLDIRKPSLVLSAGFLIAFGNAILSSLISLIIFGGFSTYKPTEGIYLFFFRVTDSMTAATLLHQLMVELADKTLVIFFVALLFYFIRTRITKNKK